MFLGAASLSCGGNTDITPVSSQVAAVIAIAPATTIQTGGTLVVSARAVDASGNTLAEKTFTWSSSAASIATVSTDGTVTGVAPGTVSITATSESKSGSVSLTVVPNLATVVASVLAFAPSSSGQIGTPQTVYAAALDANGKMLSGQRVTWTTSAPAIATVRADDDTTQTTVSSTGAQPVGRATVSGLSAGLVTITATVAGKSDSVTLSIGGDVALAVTAGSAPSFPPVVSDSLAISATATSLFQIESVVATVGSVRIPLSKGFGGSWQGNASISGLPYGAFRIDVAATDARGSVTRASTAVRHGASPTISLVSPAANAVVSSRLHIVANCSKADASLCTRLVVGVHDPSGSVIAAVSHFSTPDRVAEPIDTTVTISATPGAVLRLAVSAGDEMLSASLQRSVVFDGTSSNGNLRLVSSVPGVALDVQGSRVLYSDTQTVSGHNLLRIRGPGSTDILVADTVGVSLAALTPVGALYSIVRSDGTIVLRDFRGAAPIDLGSIRGVVANYAFAGYVNSNAQLVLRDEAAGTNSLLVSSNAVYPGFDVGPTGGVAYLAPSGIMLIPPGGTARAIAPSDTLCRGIPRTDGTVVVYLRNRCPGPGAPGKTDYQVAAHTAQGEVGLSAFSGLVTSQGSLSFAVNGGWVAYTSPDASGIFQPWAYSPSGVASRVTPALSGSSKIQSVGANGEVVFSGGANLYAAKPPYATLISLGALNGRVLWRDGRFVVLVGGAVFEISY